MSWPACALAARAFDARELNTSVGWPETLKEREAAACRSGQACSCLQLTAQTPSRVFDRVCALGDNAIELATCCRCRQQAQTLCNGVYSRLTQDCFVY